MPNAQDCLVRLRAFLWRVKPSSRHTLRSYWFLGRYHAKVWDFSPLPASSSLYVPYSSPLVVSFLWISTVKKGQECFNWDREFSSMQWEVLDLRKSKNWMVWVHACVWGRGCREKIKINISKLICHIFFVLCNHCPIPEKEVDGEPMVERG